MSTDDNGKLGNPEDPKDQVTAPAPEQKENIGLDEMTTDMFQSKTAKNLLLWTKAVGSIGHSHSFADGLNAESLVEKIRENSFSHKKFSVYAEQLLQGILQGKFKEEDIDLPESFFVEAMQYWLYFRVGMGFGKNDESSEVDQTSARILTTLLEQNVLGDDTQTAVETLLHGALSADTRVFIVRVGKGFLDANSKRQIVDSELAAREEFRQRMQGEPAPQAAVQPSPEAAPEQAKIIKATFRILVWGKDEEFKDHQELKALVGSMNVDPHATPSKPVQIFDEFVDEGEDEGSKAPGVSEMTATLEIENGEVSLVRRGKEKIIDMDSGIPVQKLMIVAGKSVRVLIGHDNFEITMTGVDRELQTQPDDVQPKPSDGRQSFPSFVKTLAPSATAVAAAAAAFAIPAAATPANVDMTASAVNDTSAPDDSQPTIEAKEALIFKLSAVMTLDAHENALAAYPCLDDNDRVVSIGADPSNEIVLPADGKYKPHYADIKFIGRHVFVNSSPVAHIRLKGTPPNAFISITPVLLEEDKVITVGDKPNIVYFKVVKDYPFSEEDIRDSLTKRLRKITATLAGTQDLQVVSDAERKLREFEMTAGRFKDQLDITEISAEIVQLKELIVTTKTAVEQKRHLEHEAKMATRRHFDADAGETAETPRPLKYAVLIDKIYNDKKGKSAMHIIFPSGLSMGKDKVNTLEAHLPQVERTSKYTVQDHECTFVMDGTAVRLVVEPRVVKNSKIMINGELAGTRGGKTEELDMLRAPLKDGDDIQVDYDRFTLEMNHEFTVQAVKPYAKAYLNEIMEVLVLYPDHGDKGDRRNARETLEHFLATGTVTEAEVKTAQAFFEQQKISMEMTGMAAGQLKTINGDDKTLLDYVQNEQRVVGLPYDVAAFRIALELSDEPAVRWEDAGMTREEYIRELSKSAKIRLFAYDKKLLDIREKLQRPNRGARLKAMVSKDAEAAFKQEQKSLNIAFRNLLVETVSLIQFGIAGDDHNKEWLRVRLSEEQNAMAEEIFSVQSVVGKIHDGAAFSTDEVKQVLETVKGKTYGDCLNFREVPPETPMSDYMLAKINAYSKSLLNEACEGENISANLARIEELMASVLVTHETLNTTPQQFEDLRSDEAFFNKVKEGTAALGVLTSAKEASLEDILDFAKRWNADEFALSDEKEEEFKKYVRDSFSDASRRANTGEMRAYFAVMASSAIRYKLARPQELGTTLEQLEQLHEQQEHAEAVTEMLALSEEAGAAGIHNLHPLLKLKNHLAKYEAGSLNHEGTTGESMLQEHVGKKLDAMLSHVVSGGDPGFMEMILADMRQYGLEPMMRASIRKTMDETIGAMFEGTKTVDQTRPLVETLRLMGLDDLMVETASEVVQPLITQSFDNPDESAVKNLEKFGADLRSLGLN